ncbi:ABC transporter ATP-binding protein [Alkaliphilus serpentinus]|nr:phosphate ABC transporter ATP-binding protein [Alkaliphilus serpentinus]
MINVEDISVARNHQTILKEITLSFKEGEFINIMGPSGSGKSTFLKLLNGLESFNGGVIRYDGRDILEIDPIDLRREVGYVFQVPYLFGEKVRENIEYPIKLGKLELDEDYVTEMLTSLNLKKEILDKKCKDLSGGEQQRISLLRSLMLRPKVLLLDEITSSLDPINTKLVEEFIKDIYKKYHITIILVTHSVEQAKRMGSRTVFFKEGTVFMDSTTEEFFSHQQKDFIKEFIES